MERWTLYQLGYIALAIIPGIAAYGKLINPIQAGFIVLMAYIMSRRHSNEIQRKFDAELEKEQQRRKEEEAVAALPAKKRKNIEKGKARRRTAESAAASEGEEVEAEKETKDGEGIKEE